jgi:hypothetical protein
MSKGGSSQQIFAPRFSLGGRGNEGKGGRASRFSLPGRTWERGERGEKTGFPGWWPLTGGRGVLVIYILCEIRIIKLSLWKALKLIAV